MQCNTQGLLLGFPHHTARRGNVRKDGTNERTRVPLRSIDPSLGRQSCHPQRRRAGAPHSTICDTQESNFGGSKQSMEAKEEPLR